MKKRRKILIYYFGHVGDTLVTYPAFRMSRKNYPDADLILMNHYTTNYPLQAELFADDGLFSEVHLLPPPRNLREKLNFYLSYLRLLLKYRFDRVFSFAFNHQYSKIIAVGSLLFQFKKQVLSQYQESVGGSIYQAYINQLQDRGLTFSEEIFNFPLTEAELLTAEKTAEAIQDGSDIPMIAFGIGGKKPVCLWKQENYIQLIKLLKTKMDFLPVYTGGPSEKPFAEKLIASCGGVFLPDTDCKTLRETLAFYRKCLCYIGNDTGSAHLAGIAGTKCAILYSAHCLPEEKWHPVGKGHLFIRKNVPCSGCQYVICPKESGSCIDMITPEEVVEKVIPWIAAI